MRNIRIPSTWADGAAVSEFKLGLGPCGKIVEKLSAWTHEGFYVVEQQTTDGEIKRFLYPLHTLTGRVIETY